MNKIAAALLVTSIAMLMSSLLLLGRVYDRYQGPEPAGPNSLFLSGASRAPGPDKPHVFASSGNFAFPIGPAGGALTGQYPNPGLDAAAIPSAAYPCKSLVTGGFGPTGTSDDGPTFNAALLATAGTGFAVCVPYISSNGGAYLIQTAITPVSNSTLLLAQGVTIKGVSGLTGNGVVAFTANPVGATTTTLASNVGGTQIGVPQNTFTVVSATGFVIGKTALLQSVDGWPRGYYGITNVSGTTITVDRPIVWPFLSGDAAEVMAVDPTLQNFDIEGLGYGATITGGGATHALFIIGHKHIKVANLKCVPPASGLNFSTACFGEELGWDSRFEDLYEVSTSSFAPGKGFSLGSDENQHVERCISVSPDGALSTNFEIYDETSLDFHGNVGLNANTACMILGTETSNTARPGVVDSSFTNNTCIGAVGAGEGIEFVNNSSRNSFTNTLIAVNGYPASQIGVYFNGGSSDNSFTGLTLYNSLEGVVLDAINTGNNRNQFANVVFGGLTGNWYKTIDVEAGNTGTKFTNVSMLEGYTGFQKCTINGDTSIDGFTGSFSSGNGFVVGATSLRLSRATMTLDATSASTSGIITTSSSSVVGLDRVTCTLLAGATCVNNGGGHIRMTRLTGSGTGVGLLAAGGSSSINELDGTSDLSNFSTPRTDTSGTTGAYGTTAAGDQLIANTITATSGTVTPTALQAASKLQIFSASLAGDLTFDLPNATNGMWWADVNGVTFNAHNLILECGTGSTAVTLSVASANQKILMCRCDGSNNLYCNL